MKLFGKVIPYINYLIFNYKNDGKLLFLCNSNRSRKQIMSVIRKESQGKEPPHEHC